ncbi:hypothetical protein TNCV_716141 [Trichonephila clavipes]|nr:hypothetical protein TNCV_716141 [Trichonephila clavipes]
MELSSETSGATENFRAPLKSQVLCPKTDLRKITYLASVRRWDPCSTGLFPGIRGSSLHGGFSAALGLEFIARRATTSRLPLYMYLAAGGLAVRASDSRPEDLVPCLNCRGGDRWSFGHSGNFAELNRTVTSMMLKANDRRTSSPLPR